jgi:hypothetical protein
MKNAWWSTLDKVKKALKPVIVGLTATPPYDVSYTEWSRYIDLNGPVDSEISVPELVASGDLCPHQDYVYLSLPTNSEKDAIRIFKDKIRKLFDDLLKDKELIDNLENLPGIKNPKDNLDWIYSNIEFYSSILIYLNSARRIVSIDHMDILGDEDYSIPQMSYKWMEILLTNYLFRYNDLFDKYENHRDILISKIKRAGAVDKKVISFEHNPKIDRYLNFSLGKLDSINEIVKFEYQGLGKSLRMVILTDYIRKEFLVNKTENRLAINKIGVIPIFELLRRNSPGQLKIGVLTGSIVIIPETAYPEFKEQAGKSNIENISSEPLSFDGRYIRINVNDAIRSKIVQIVTSIFQRGQIEVLIGTKSLLGEGWDAPATNSLILASFVGSYVSSNQMRGRAIRRQMSNPGKTSNIWHLVCIDQESKYGGDDLQIMKRRFKAFVGVSDTSENGIENGISRLGLPGFPFSGDMVHDFNNRSLKQAKDREILSGKWQTAIKGGKLLIEEIKLPYKRKGNFKAEKKLYLDKTLSRSFAGLAAVALPFLNSSIINLITKLFNWRGANDLYYWLLGTGIIGAFLLGRKSYEYFRLYISYRDISKDFHKIAESLLLSLIKAGLVITDISELEIITVSDDNGAIYCHLNGGSTYERSLFLQSIEEIVSPVQNPRYLIIRKSKLINLISQQDYHAVPETLGVNKDTAGIFESYWKNLVGECDLVFTRNPEGRKLILKSRIESLSSVFEENSERLNKWR